MVFYRKMDGYIFKAPSKKMTAKYDVYDAKTGDYITSFGSIFYMQYKDRIGYYKILDHGDLNRRHNYLRRHSNDYNVPPYPSYFSKVYLW